MSTKGTTSLALKNVAPVWRRAFGTAKSRVLVFSPYLTSTSVLRQVAAPLALYTEFSLELFASGASTFRVLKEVFAWPNAEVFWLPNLHAKIIVVDDGMLTVGSQNMTARGERNLEATTIVHCPEQVKVADETLRKWMQQAEVISQDMLDEMEALLPAARKQYLLFKQLCSAGEAQLRLVEAERKRQTDAAYQLELERQARLASAKQRVESGVAHVRHRINALFPDNTISEETAKDFVARSAWWLKHRYGPVRSPGAAKHVFWVPGLGYCWSYARDSNKYMVSRAIQMCVHKLGWFLDNTDWQNKPMSREAMSAFLRSDLFDFVANCNNEEYPGRYGGIRDNDIVFGTSSIDMNDFAICFLDRYCDVAPLFAAVQELKGALQGDQPEAK